MEDQITIQQFADGFFKDESIVNSAKNAIDSGYMLLRAKRADLGVKYYLDTFVLLADVSPDLKRTKWQHLNHLNRFIISHIRQNEKLMRAEQTQSDPYSQYRRNRE